MTQEAFGNVIGLSRTHVNKLFGNTRPWDGRDTVNGLIDGLGMTYEQLRSFALCEMSVDDAKTIVREKRASIPDDQEIRKRHQKLLNHAIKRALVHGQLNSLTKDFAAAVFTRFDEWDRSVDRMAARLIELDADIEKQIERSGRPSGSHRHTPK